MYFLTLLLKKKPIIEGIIDNDNIILKLIKKPLSKN